MKRPDYNPGDNGMSVSTPDAQMLKAWPNLCTYLTDAKWDDGSDRELPTLIFFASDGGWKLCLSDKALERTAWAFGTGLSECLSCMEKGLATGKIEWRRASSTRGGAARKRS